MEQYLQGSDETAYGSQYTKKKLQDHFGEIDEYFSQAKQDDYEAEKQRLVETAAKLLKNDIRSLNYCAKEYPSCDDLSSIKKAIAYLPKSLRLFMNILVAGKNPDKKIASIGQALIRAARPRVLLTPLQLGLGVQMHHHFASKLLVDTLQTFGFCTSYATVKSFEEAQLLTKVPQFPGTFMAILYSTLQTM